MILIFLTQKWMPTKTNETIIVCKKEETYYFETYTLWFYTSMNVVTILVISTAVQWCTFLTIIRRRAWDSTVLSNIAFATCCPLKRKKRWAPAFVHLNNERALSVLVFLILQLRIHLFSILFQIYPRQHSRTPDLNEIIFTLYLIVKILYNIYSE